MIEVLIALFVLSFGLLSMVGMQLTALRHSREAYYSSLAITQLNSMLERLRANDDSVTRDAELNRWNQLNQQLLPQGDGSYQCQQTACKVTISWQDQAMQSLSMSAQ